MSSIYISNGRLGAQTHFDGAQRIKNDRYRKRQKTSCLCEPVEGRNTANEGKSYTKNEMILRIRTHEDHEVCFWKTKYLYSRPELELEGYVGRGNGVPLLSYILINTKLKYSVTHNFLLYSLPPWLYFSQYKALVKPADYAIWAEPI